MADIISNIGLFVTGAATWVGSTISIFTAEGNEILLLPMFVGFLGVGLGLVKRAARTFR